MIESNINCICINYTTQRYNSTILINARCLISCSCHPFDQTIARSFTLLKRTSGSCGWCARLCGRTSFQLSWLVGRSQDFSSSAPLRLFSSQSPDCTLPSNSSCICKDRSSLRPSLRAACPRLWAEFQAELAQAPPRPPPELEL